MKFNVLLLILFLLPQISRAAEEPMKITGLSKDEKKLARFIGGIEMMESERTLSPAEQAAWYQKICELTGLTSEKIKELIDRFKNNPEKWAKILEFASQEISKKEDEQKDKKSEVKK